MVSFRILTAVLLVAACARGVPAQQSAGLSAGVRPQRVRVGDTFVVTVRFVGRGWPEELELDLTSAVEVMDVRDRSSTGVGVADANLVLERDFVLRALRAGDVMPGGAWALLNGDTIRAGVPDVEAVSAPLAWADRATTPRARRPEQNPLDQGVPPSAGGRDADRRRAPEGLWAGRLGPAAPYGPVPWGTAYGYDGSPYGSPYGSSYGLPYGSAGPLLPGSPFAPASPFGPGSLFGQGAPYGNGIPFGTGTPYAPGSPFGVQGPYGTTSPFAGGYPPLGSPYGPSGWGVSPDGRGWAPGAAGDPWWPELVPQLDGYASVADDPSGLVRLEAGLTPDRVYVGQQVTLVATATFAPEAVARLGGSPEFFPSSASNAWSVEIPYAPPNPAAVRGRVHEAHTFMRAFFPVQPGVLTVEPARLRYSVGAAAVGRPPLDTLSTGTLSVEVLPVPARQAPAAWTGAVGRYRVAAWLQPPSVGWGEAALLTVEVAGAGHVRELARPDPGPVWGAELRPVGERAVVEVRDGVVGGVKTFSWLVAPVEPGLLRIGPIVFAFFDPWLGAFGQVATEEIVLESIPFPGDVESPEMGGGAGRSPTDRRGESGEGRPAVGAPGDEAPPAVESPADEIDGGGSSTVMTEAGSFRRATPDALPAPAESEARALSRRVVTEPRDASAWLALSEAYRLERPGEGWAEWALTSGLRHAPRDPALRSALWGDPSWRAPEVGGLPRLPLSAVESLGLAGGLGLAGLGLMGALARGVMPLGRRSGVSAVAILLLGAAMALGPWLELRHEEWGVVVGGTTHLRVMPARSAEEVARVEGGAAVRLEDRFGSWVRVSGTMGAEGWAEMAQIVPLERPPAY